MEPHKLPGWDSVQQAFGHPANHQPRTISKHTDCIIVDAFEPHNLLAIYPTATRFDRENVRGQGGQPQRTAEID